MGRPRARLGCQLPPPLRGGSGVWGGRKIVGGKYQFNRIALADDYEDGDGLRVCNWSQAQAAIRAWAASRQRTGPVTVEAAVAAYADDLRVRKGDAAAEDVLGRLKKHLLPVFGSRRLDDVSHAEWLAWRNNLVRLDGNDELLRKSRITSNRIFGMARAAANHAFNTGLVADDRSWRKVKQFRGVAASRQVIFSDAELQVLVDACEPGLRELVLIASWTGCRLGELTSVRVRDFDPGDATLRVAGKTGARDVFLPQSAVELLVKLTTGRPADAPLLVTVAGTRWTKELHHRPFARAVAKAGLDPRATFYALRHSYISAALVRGIPTQALAAHCGTSATMIERNYAKFVQSDRRKYAAIAAPTLRIESFAAET